MTYSNTLKTASQFMRYRRFDKAIQLLEGRIEIYDTGVESSFEYYLLLGTACLYAGDIGSARKYFNSARKIKLTDVNMLLGQAAIFLRRGETDRAIGYYTDVLGTDPNNKIAKKALEFIRTCGDFNTICTWVDNGKIEQFYPPIGLNPYKVLAFVMPVLTCILGFVLVFSFLPRHLTPNVTRADISSLFLTVDEKKNAKEVDLSSGSFGYILSAKQISACYDKAIVAFQKHRDNISQIEINRILNSNASLDIKQKARNLMDFLESPNFDSLKDNIEYKDVEKEIALYMDCYVIWSGRIANLVELENSLTFDLLLGYEDMKKVEAVVPVAFVNPPILQTEKPVKVLGKITTDGGKLLLQGKAVYQSVKN